MRKYFAARLAAFATVAVTLALLFAAAAPAQAAGVTPLVTPGWLNQHLKDPSLVVLDIRSALDGGGEKAYVAAHIPGSVHSNYDKAGWRVTRNNVPFMLPSQAQLEKLIGDIGIDDGSHVVVVPAGVSFTDFGAAARVYWTLKISGVKNVSILDGGVAAWKQAGLPMESGTKTLSPAIFTATLDKNLLAEVSDVETAESSSKATLLDARPASYFAGKEKAPAAAAYGHIPGALNLDSAAFYDAKTNQLKSKEELASIAALIPANRPVVSYCNTGHWAATDWFVLHEVLGRSNVRLYDGSMVEWSASARRPVHSSRTKWDDLKKALGLGS
jgi:thiosulfate/3-mercaptopyruvate sulfurtransferase